MSRFRKHNPPTFQTGGVPLDSNTLVFLEDNHLDISEENKALLSRNYSFVDRLFAKKDIVKMVDGIKRQRLETDAELKQFALQLAVDAKKEMAELEIRNMVNARAIQKNVQLDTYARAQLNAFFETASAREEELIEAIKKAEENITKISHLPRIKQRMDEALYTRIDDFLVFMDITRKDLLRRVEILLK